ncbi:MAG: hypothetical protein Q9169_003104 [Polycauliona sp. 2 TL-2023]
MHAYFFSNLLVGKVFPQQRPSRSSGRFHIFAESYRQADISVFSAMNQSLYAKFQKVFWSENMWVIGPGRPTETVRSLWRLPQQSKKLIRKVELKFSIVDIRKELQNTYPVALAKALGRFPPPSRDYEVPGNDLVWLYDRLSYEFWKLKYQVISCLELEELTLDFTDALSLDGHISDPLWIQALVSHPFTCQFPRKLNVWAPSTYIASKIENWIWQHNESLIEEPEDLGWQEASWDGAVNDTEVNLPGACHDVSWLME